MTGVGYLYLVIFVLTLHENSAGVDGGGGPYSVTREAVVGVDSLDDVLDSLPSEGGLLRLTYNNSEGPTVMKTLNLKNKRVAVQGQGKQGALLTCNGNESALRIMGGHVEVLDLVIYGCQGSAVEVVSPNPPRIEWMVQFHRCRFVNNSQAIKRTANEGSPSGDLVITKSEFISNRASAVELHDVNSLVISHSKFENNTSGSSGGGLMLKQSEHQETWSVNVSESLFKGNRALLGRGGGISVETSVDGDMRIRLTEFKNNTANIWGGGVSLWANISDVEVPHEFPTVSVGISGCRFSDNKAVNNSGGLGGGIAFVNISAVIVESSEFEQCISNGSGGSVAFVYLPVHKPWIFNVSRSLFKGNRAQLSGGGINVVTTVDGRMNMQDNSITNNTAGNGGGLELWAYKNEIEVTYDFPNVVLGIFGSVFLDNKALRSIGGGIVLGNISSVVVESTLFEQCEAVEYGGSLYSESKFLGKPWMYQIIQSTFKGNRAGFSGGSMVFFTCVDGDMRIQNTNFVNNTAKHGGGFILQAFKGNFAGTHDLPIMTVGILNCFFLNNKAVGGFGGGIVLMNATSVKVESTVFEQCAASLFGGSLTFAINSGRKNWVFEVMRSVFKENWAGSNGGAIDVTVSVDGAIVVQDTNFTCNTAGNGGGIAVLSDIGDLQVQHDHPNVTAEIVGSNFFDNKAVRGMGGCIWFNEVYSVNLETTVFENCSSNNTGGGILSSAFFTNKPWVFNVTKSLFKGNKANMSSGGICLQFVTDGIMTIQDTNLTNNTASSWGGGVGIMIALDVVEFHPIAVDPGPNVSVNVLRSNFVNNTVEQAGGGLYLDGVRHATVESSVFEECRTQNLTGGGIHFLGNTIPKGWVLNVSKSVFRRNTAEVDFGGGIFISCFSDGITWIHDTIFIANKAMRGGGIAGRAILRYPGDLAAPHHFPNVTINMEKCIFLNNTGFDHGGGGLFANFTVGVISSCQFQAGRADWGGGLVWYSTYKSGNLSLIDSNFSQNVVQRIGAGVFFQDTGKLRMTRCTFEENKSEGDAGGIYLVASGMLVNDIILLNSSFIGNKALVGGAISAVNVPSMIIQRVMFYGNKAVVGGAALMNPGSTLAHTPVILECHFVGNTAKGRIPQDSMFAEFAPFSGGGGAIAIISFFHSRSKATTIWTVMLKSSKFESNTAENGGALLATSPENNTDSWLIVKACTFDGNYAVESGGAIVVDNPKWVNITCIDEQTSKSLQQISPAYCKTWKGNKAVSGSGMYGNPNVVAALSLGSIQLNQSHVQKRESRPKFPPISLTVIDILNGSRRFGGIGEVVVTAGCHNKQVVLFGQTSQFVVNETAVFSDLRAWGPPGEYAITFNATNTIGLYSTETIQANLTFELRDCEIGERNVKEGNYLRCEHCNLRFFSFDPTSRTCEECVEHAECNSTEDNPMHPLVPKDGYWHSSPFSKQLHKCLDEISCKYDGRKKELQRFKGSDGPLCGSCLEGYGHTKNGRCTKCRAKLGSILVIVLSAMWTAILMCITIAGNLSPRSNEPDEIPLVHIQHHEERDETNSEAVTESIGAAAHSFTEGDRFTAMRSLQVFKIALNFFQVNSSALLLNFGWISFLSGWLQFQDVSTIASTTSHGTWLVPECALHSKENRSLYIAFLNVLLPIGLAIVIAVSWLCIRVVRTRDVSVKTEIEIILWSAAFYAYNGLTKSFMAMFNCIKVDRNYPTDPLNSFAISKDLYWVVDTNFRCYHGSHGRYLLPMGLAGAIFFLIGLPLCLCIFLYKMKDQLVDHDFKKKYGFLFHIYRDQYCYWEATIMMRKFFVTTIGVFAASLGVQLQSHLVLGVMVIAVVVHMHSTPFKDPKLNLLEVWSLLTTCCTFYLGGIANDLPTSWKPAMSLMVLLLNLAFCAVIFVNLKRSIVEAGVLKKVLESPFVRNFLYVCRTVLCWCVCSLREIRKWVAWRLRDWI